MRLLKDKLPGSRLHQHNDESEWRTCYACDEVIELRSWYYNGYGKYNVLCDVHKICGEFPEEITYPLHPQHLLEIKYYYYPDQPSCYFCNRSASSRFMYRCKSCDFHVDLLCGIDSTLKLLSSKSIEERERTTLKDLNHHHQLTLMTIPSRGEDDDDDDDDKDDVAIIQKCRACLQPIADSTYYMCREESEGCKDYFLHTFCGELPVEMKHELHPLHSLMLMISPPLKHFKCFVCRKYCEGHIYSCRTCSFQLDIICATSRSRVLEHKCHQHPLMLLPSPSSSFCHACCRVHDGIFYQCNTCMVFFIHQDCASLGYVTYHPSHEGHPLRLGYHSDGSQKRNKCDICYLMICDQTGWFYYCWECKFYAHLNCIRSENDEGAEDIDPKQPCLPWEEAYNEFGTVGLLNRKLASVEDDDDKNSKMDKINHFSHPDHSLILQSDVPREANPYSIGEKTLTTQCNGCCKLISAPLYSCVDCNFYIHKGCALLPTSIAQHHDHSEHDQCRLVLLREPWYETRLFICNDCDHRSNGFSYQCEEESCDYKIDVECAFLPSKIVHEAHPFHTLSLASSYVLHLTFKCCSAGIGSGAYMCDTCNFVIHARCAMYPAKVHHRFDSDSPFMLSFNPSNLEPNEYHYCDICEDILDPKKWYYFSSKMGGLIMHSECILHRDRVAVKNPNFKSVSSLIGVDNHPHLLHFYPTYSSRQDCYHCEMLIKDHLDDTTDVRQERQFAYQCVEWDCEYNISIRCANKLVLQEEEDIQPSVDTGMINLYLEGTGRTCRRGNLVTITSKVKISQQSSSRALQEEEEEEEEQS